MTAIAFKSVMPVKFFWRGAGLQGNYFYSARMHYINHLHKNKLIQNKFSINNNKGLLDTKSAY